MTADLSALIARLEAAHATGIIMESEAVALQSALGLEDAHDIDWKQCCWNALKGSLDAALALAERVLPGWLWDVTTITTAVGGLRKPLASVVRPDQQEGEEIKTWGYASTPALALVIAIIRAKQGDKT